MSEANQRRAADASGPVGDGHVCVILSGGVRLRHADHPRHPDVREAAQRHFLTYGVGTSLEAVAKEAGVGPATLYRHFPSEKRCWRACCRHARRMVARRADIARLGDACEALRQWLRAMEDYFSAFSGLPEPLMAAARAQEPDNPLTLTCDILIALTEE